MKILNITKEKYIFLVLYDDWYIFHVKLVIVNNFR